jgi:uncharacterized protein (DUF427 family)
MNTAVSHPTFKRTDTIYDKEVPDSKPDKLINTPNQHGNGLSELKAIWNNQVIAESDETIVVEGNHYFPRDSIFTQYFTESETHTTCVWKGLASYFNVVVDDEINRNAAWYYPNPSQAAMKIKDYIAFWHGVRVVE